MSRLPSADEFSEPTLGAQWQWNHNPDDARWSLTERPGWLRLQASAAPNLASARNTLTQRTEGPRCTATIRVDTSGLQPGDRAGLCLLQGSYGYLAVAVDTDGRRRLERVVNADEGLSPPREEVTDTVADLAGTTLWLRASCDFATDSGFFSYSEDGATYAPVGGRLPLRFTLVTFQGVRFGVFCYNPHGGEGRFDVDRFSREDAGDPAR